jgi:ketosteroid isomerase-like protein
MSEMLELFRTGYLAARARFNEHDFEGAFAALSEDVEWHPMTDWGTVVGVKVGRGRGAVIAFFRDLLDEMPDWRGEPEGFVEVGERVFIVRARVEASGKASGALVSQAFSQVWELKEEGLVLRVREYADHDEALVAARASAERSV